MKVTLSPTVLNGEISAPPSKSCMHRALICAAASEKPTKIICSSFSMDTKATISCLEALGAKFECGDGFVTVYPIDKNVKSDTQCILDCGESGSTLRFMLPFAAALGRNCKFIGAKRLGERPLAPLCKALNSHGVETHYSEGSFLPLEINGTLSKDVFEIPGNISSQFITGLLFALGVLGGGEIKITGELKSAPYIDITADIQRQFGISVKKTDTGYTVAEGQGYTSPGETVIEGDYSNAAFWLVAGAVGSSEKICCKNLRADTLQGDSAIIDVLRDMGAHITRDKDSVTVYKSRLHAIEADCADIPDIVPIICVAATAAEGTTLLRNIERLREKESDRVKTTLDMLIELGANISADEKTITVSKSVLCGGCVTSANDHRIAMSSAIASTLCKDIVEIDIAEAVSKSYPDFYEKFSMLGGKVR